MKIALISSHLEGLTEDTEIGFESMQISRAAVAKGGELILVDPTKLSYGIENNIAFARFESLGGTVYTAHDIDALLVRRTRGFIEQIMDFAEIAEQANRALVRRRFMLTTQLSLFGGFQFHRLSGHRRCRKNAGISDSFNASKLFNPRTLIGLCALVSLFRVDDTPQFGKQFVFLRMPPSTAQ